MNNYEHWANLYCQRKCVIDGRHVWLYLIQSSIGNIAVVDYEGKSDPSITRKLFCDNYEKAERYFERICAQKAKGVI